VGMISTVGALIGEEVVDTGFHVTTPDSPSLQSLLAKMVAYESSPITHVVLETSSHGLAQHRVAACEYDIGVFTNVTHEHLDFHGSYENYLAAKARLIEELAKTGQKPQGNRRLTVLNRDDQSFAFLYNYALRFPSVGVITYGRAPEAEIRAAEVKLVNQYPQFTVLSKGRRYSVQLELMGEYNVYNALAAWGATVEGLGVAPELAVEGLARVRAIPGRMERIDLGQPYLAIVDFAHTPHALENALIAARKLAQGKVIAVFGSAGLRDREKRWLMAEVGSKLADVSILTAEDPRTERLEDILLEMKKGADRGGGEEGVTYFRIADRREAIRMAVKMAAPGDVVLVLGKGHEQSMCFGEIEYPWDDRIALRSAIAEQLGIPGPAMPYLPS
ncbi:MAG: UDP-N-acetylmuramoyl-L-alanyl-D-glutamate--2,6-diaminopimelate ligase, partial [Anaerolineales bacterium]|nr:UDP-N-acetylmuramoyl-L-alanyl-D-glutamate--2,6-diaminopimelate ligase [Anaerolineales bacterium]MDW8446750.1 UDP-N-acetylmuramoyl-L-alanyl-D-glutamate--2,6-diaminopimelate ligase [Anaerolineales bacterium]